MIKAILVDDERIALEGLATTIGNLCPEVEIVGVFDNPREAQSEIPVLQPDVVFLDIEMPNINGFSLLRNLAPVDFEVIFTTAYSEYAINALRISALDFLLKPVDREELLAAVGRLEERVRQKSTMAGRLEEQIRLFLEYQKHPDELTTIAIPVINGLEFIDISSIVRVAGENVYSVFHLVDGRKITVSRTLKEVEQLLTRRNFMRVHKSHIINMKYIKRYIKGEGGVVILSDGSEVEISRREKNAFLQRVNEFR